MSKTPPTRLDSGLIARKGEAAPATAAPIEPPAASAPASITPESRAASVMPKGVGGTIAVTVRLDPERYERLKIHGARQRRTNQQILVAALDAYLMAPAES